MSRKTFSFQQSDIARAIKGAEKAGLMVEGRIDDRGSIILTRVQAPCPMRMPFIPTTRTRNLKGYVYFIRVHDFVKIGFSVNVRNRLETLQAGSPYPFDRLLVERGFETTEREYHVRFRDYRAAGEWFRIEGELAQFLREKAT